MKFSSERLRSAIERDGRKAKAIALSGEFSASALSQWASGERTPGAEELGKLATALGISIESFFEGDVPSSYALQEDMYPHVVDDLASEMEELIETVHSIQRKISMLKSGKYPRPNREDSARQASLSPDEIAQIAGKGAVEEVKNPSVIYGKKKR